MNINETSSNEINSEAEQKKHFLTLHIFHKGQQKVLHFRIRHVLAVCAAVAVVAGGSVYSLSAYQNAKNELQASQQQLQETERVNRKLEQKTEILETENSQYNENIETIQNKATELEQKMNELETMKEDLYNQINTINSTDSSVAEIYSAVAGSIENPPVAAPTFTTIVSTSYNKVASLSTQLDKMDVMLDQTGISFTTVATDVTETLASYSNIPTGYPVESTIISTEFNPNGDPSISDGRTHKGIDISTRSQILPITATAAGTVVTADYHNDFGYYVVIDHGNGFTTLYAHNSQLTVSVGDKVKKGDTIAMAGSTGNSSGVHCHYEIQLNGIYQNPRDYL